MNRIKEVLEEKGLTQIWLAEGKRTGIYVSKN